MGPSHGPLWRPRSGVPVCRRPHSPAQRGGPTSSTKQPKKRASTHRNRKQPSSPPETDGLPQRASFDRPCRCVDPHTEKVRGSLGFCRHLPSPSFQKPPVTGPSQSLTEYEILKRTFQDSANRCHQIGIRFTPVVSDGRDGGWTDSARTLATCRTNINLLYLPKAQRHQSRTGSAHLFVTSPWLSVWHFCDAFAKVPRGAVLFHRRRTTGGPPGTTVAMARPGTSDTAHRLQWSQQQHLVGSLPFPAKSASLLPYFGVWCFVQRIVTSVRSERSFSDILCNVWSVVAAFLNASSHQ